MASKKFFWQLRIEALKLRQTSSKEPLAMRSANASAPGSYCEGRRVRPSFPQHAHVFASRLEASLGDVQVPCDLQGDGVLSCLSEKTVMTLLSLASVVFL